MESEFTKESINPWLRSLIILWNPYSVFVSNIPRGEYVGMAKFAITNFDFVLLVKVLARFCISFSFFSTKFFLSDTETEYGRWKRSSKMFLVSIIRNVISGENLYKLLSWFRISWLY